MDGAVRQFRQVLRRLRRGRADIVVACTVLTLAIGGTALVFSVAAALLFGPEPYAHAESLAVVRPNPSDWRLYGLWSERRDLFESVAAYNERAVNLSGDGAAERVVVGRVTEGFLALTGTAVAIGRPFAREEFTRGRDSVAILTDQLWRRRFGASRSVIGLSLTLDDRAFTIIGVLPPDFRAPTALVSARGLSGEVGAAAVVPLVGDPHERDPLSTDRLWRGVMVLVRLRPDTSLQRARLFVSTTALGLAGSREAGRRHTLVTLAEYVAGDLPAQLAVLAGAVGLLFAVACANVGHLLLARGLSRSDEMATRLALGASRRHLIWCVLDEAILLVFTSASIGLVLAWTGSKVVSTYGHDSVSHLDTVGIDWRVLGMTLLVSVGATLLVGAVPGLDLSRADPAVTVGARRHEQVPWRLANVRSVFGIIQVALSFVLLTGAGRLELDLSRLAHTDMGFRTVNVLTAEVSLSRREYPDAGAAHVFFAECLHEIAGVFGVRMVALTNTAPGGPSESTAALVVRGREGVAVGGAVAGSVEATEQVEVVGGEYFRLLSIPIRFGRALNERDAIGARRVVVVNDTFARKYWGQSARALDGQVFFGHVGYDVVGVAGDVRTAGPMAAAPPVVYFPYGQYPGWPASQMALLVLTGGAPAAWAGPVTEAVERLNPNQPIHDVLPLERLVAAPLARAKLFAAMASLFGILTLLVAAAGLYGATLSGIVARAHESAVRVALGASPAALLLAAASRGARLVAAGLSCGLPIALWGSAIMTTTIVGTTRVDAEACAIASLVVAFVALGASLLPALAAMRKDPLEGLRHE